MSDTMTLYDIAEALVSAMARAEEYAEANGGELSERLNAELDRLEMARGEKIGNICRYIKDLRAQSAAIGYEVETLRGRQASKEKKADGLEAWLAAMLEFGEEYEDAASRVKCGASYTTEIDSVEQIPAEYMRVIPEQVIPESKAPDKNAIKAAVKKGIDVPGAHVEKHKQLKMK